ncbi:hypothetical protein D3C76_1556750 [compost metagenome]
MFPFYSSLTLIVYAFHQVYHEDYPQQLYSDRSSLYIRSSSLQRLSSLPTHDEQDQRSELEQPFELVEHVCSLELLALHTVV